MPSPVLERRIARGALGAWALCLGLIWLAVSLGFVQGVAAEDSQDLPYLAGLWARSLAAPYQRVLLAAGLAVPAHAIWVVMLYGPNAARGYDLFGQWAQTLLTSMGFLGTIVGISLAVAGLENAMENAAPGALISGLATAFDTTFLGLLGAIAIMVLRKALSLWAAK